MREYLNKLSLKDSNLLSLLFMCCLFLTLPLKQNFSSISLILLAIVSIINWVINFDRKPKINVDFYSFNIIFSLVALLLLIVGLTSILLNPLAEDFKINRLSFSLLLFGFLLFFNLKIFKIFSLRYIIYSLLVGLSISGFFRIFIGLHEYFLFDNFFLFTRIDTSFSSILSCNPIVYGVFINICWAFALFQFLKNKISIIKVTILFFALILFLLTNFSLTGLVLVVINSILIISYFYFTKLYKIQVIGLILTSVVFFVFLLSNAGNTILSSVEGESSRVRNYQTSLSILEDLPILGFGVGNELSVLQKHRNPNSWEFRNRYHAHNQYFEFLIGGGIIYLITFLSLILLTIIRGLKNDNLLLVVFMITVMFTMYIESLLVIHKGFLFVSFFWSYLIFYGKDEK